MRYYKKTIKLILILILSFSVKGQNIDSIKSFTTDYRNKINSCLKNKKHCTYINKLNNIPDSVKIFDLTWDGYAIRNYLILKKTNGIGGDEIIAKNNNININLCTLEYGGTPGFITAKGYNKTSLFIKDTLIYYEVSISNYFMKMKTNSYIFKYYFPAGRLVYSEKQGFTLRNRKKLIKKTLKKHKSWHMKI